MASLKIVVSGSYQSVLKCISQFVEVPAAFQSLGKSTSLTLELPVNLIQKVWVLDFPIVGKLIIKMNQGCVDGAVHIFLSTPWFIPDFAVRSYMNNSILKIHNEHLKKFANELSYSAFLDDHLVCKKV